MKTKKEILERIKAFDKFIKKAELIGDTQSINFAEIRQSELRWVIRK